MTNAVLGRTEAMSVLDLQHLRKQGLEDTLGTELWVSCAFHSSHRSARRGGPEYPLELHPLGSDPKALGPKAV